MTAGNASIFSANIVIKYNRILYRLATDKEKYRKTIRNQQTIIKTNNQRT